MRLALAILTVSLGGLAASANASQWNLTYDGHGANLLTNVAFNASNSWNAGPASNFNAIHTGAHKFHIGNLHYETYCVQVFEGLNVGETTCFDEVDPALVPDGPPAPGPMGALKATLVHDLYWRFYDFAKDDGVDAATSNIRNAAFQLALYEVTHEKINAADASGAVAQLGLGQGAFQAGARSGTPGSSTAVDMATEMLLALGTNGFHYFGNGLRGLTNPTRQDQLIVVPIPAAIGLAVAGLAGIGVIRRRATKR